MVTNIEFVPEVKPDRELKVKDILRFVNPPDRFHSPSLFLSKVAGRIRPFTGWTNLGRGKDAQGHNCT